MESIYNFSEADLVVGGLFPTVERYSMFDLSTPYMDDALNAYVTARLPVPRWQYPFAVLSLKIWAAVFGLMAILGMIHLDVFQQSAANHCNSIRHQSPCCGPPVASA